MFLFLAQNLFRFRLCRLIHSLHTIYSRQTHIIRMVPLKAIYDGTFHNIVNATDCIDTLEMITRLVIFTVLVHVSIIWLITV